MDAVTLTALLPTPAAPPREASPAAPPGPGADDGTPSFARELQRSRGSDANANAADANADTGAAAQAPRRPAAAAHRGTPAPARPGRGTATPAGGAEATAEEAQALSSSAAGKLTSREAAPIVDAALATADGQPLPRVPLPPPPADEMLPSVVQAAEGEPSTAPGTEVSSTGAAEPSASTTPLPMVLPSTQPLAQPPLSTAPSDPDADAHATTPARRIVAGDKLPAPDATATTASAAATPPPVGHDAREALIEGLRATDAPRVAGDGTAAPAPAGAAASAAPASFAGELARLLTPASAATAAPSVAELQLPVPVPSPEFVPRLSGEIALLARDGVQEARVQVHPLELGPISVQITVDGSAAQVHLAVDNAHTRQLLESAMPTLAGALRENGLTLTGGGVFEQSRQGSQPGDEGRGAGHTTGATGLHADGGDAAAADAAPRRARVTSALDLYA